MTAEPLIRPKPRGPKRKRRKTHLALADDAVRSRVAIYCRISLDRNKNELGVEAQEEYCRNLAERLGWTVVRVYVENDRTAYGHDGLTPVRPEFAKLMAALRGGLIDGIVTYQQDRLLREPSELEQLIRDVEQHDVAIRGVALGTIDLSTAAGRMQARNLVNYSNFESDLKGERVAASIDRRRRLGMWPNGVRLFGYLLGGELHPEESPALRQVAQQVLDGAPVAAMCTWLNEHGFTTTKGNPWSVTALKITLTNPRHAGWSVHYGELVARGQWTPQWDDATYEALVARLAYRTRGARPRRALLGRDLLLCGRCGKPMVTGQRSRPASKGKRAPKREAEKVRAYVCSRHPEHRAAGSCGGMNIAAEVVDRIVERYAYLKLNDPRVVERLRDKREVGHGPLYRRLHALRERHADLGELYRDPEAGDAREILRSRRQVANEVAELEQRLAAEIAADVAVQVPDPGTPWPTDLMARRKLIGLVVRQVRIMPGKPRVFDPTRVQIDPQPVVEEDDRG